jgi:hypothetical protein
MFFVVLTSVQPVSAAPPVITGVWPVSACQSTA